jgi:flagellar hook-associated protein 3 FlgL
MPAWHGQGDAMTTVAGATDAGMLAVMLANVANTQHNISQLTAEASSGYISADYAGLGAAAAPALDLTSQLALNKTLQTNADSASAIQQVTQTALGQIQTLVSSIASQLLSPSTSTAAGLSTVAGTAQSTLNQIAGLLDTKSGDVYVFAGQDSSNPPVPNPGNMTGSGFYAAITTALGNLGTANASTVQSQILAIASAGGTSPFSATLESSSAPATVDLGDGQRVQVGMLANQNTNAMSAGTGTTSTGSYMRDILMGLATLSGLNGADPAQTNVQSMLSNVQTVLSNAGNALNVDIGGLGARQNTITSAQTELSNLSTAVTTQLGNLQDADAASVATQLAQAQAQLQSSFSVISQMQSLTLSKYLT